MIFLNQKMNLTKEELDTIIENIKNLDVVLMPTMSLIGYASTKFNNIGAQDVSEFEYGSYTGQTSIKTLKSLGVKYCLIGHKEKRAYLNETEDKMINKIELCLKYNIIPIYIVGENKEDYLKGNSKTIIEHQITSIFNNLHCNLSNIIICYEPNWSIGSHSAETEYIEDITNTIKSIINNYYNVDLPILYGGGINELNIRDIYSIKTIDGILVGGASLKSESINKIYELTK